MQDEDNELDYLALPLRLRQPIDADVRLLSPSLYPSPPLRTL
jgi:hypothetical protein